MAQKTRVFFAVMVASYAVLSSAGAAASYFSKLTSADYYVAGGEPPGQWWGKGAEALGLYGEVQREALIRLLGGRHPFSNSQLVQIQRRSASDRKSRRDRCPGFDVCFSVPKSVSALWAVAGTDLRTQLDEIIDHAAKRTLQWALGENKLGRSGLGGRQAEFGKFAVAVFHHAVNRNWEPDRHVHMVIANLCQREDGSWGTVDSYKLRHLVRTLGPMFRATVARELQRRLGIEVYQPTDSQGQKQGWFEVHGVPEGLVKEWSSRRQEIEELFGGPSGNLKGSTGQARERANLGSRKRKQHVPPRSELFERWEKEAGKHGFDTDAAEQRVGKCKRSRRTDYAATWRQVLEEITSEHAHFNEREVIKRMCEAMQDRGVDGVTLARRVRRDLATSRDIVRLTTSTESRDSPRKRCGSLKGKCCGRQTSSYRVSVRLFRIESLIVC